jgi:hypothetical protein
MRVGGPAWLVLVMKDPTSAWASDKLLMEEGVRSSNILLIILPPVIVSMLQAGEKA